MHDSTRRTLCRLAFLVFCLMPCALSCVWIIYRATPVHAARARSFWASEIYKTTGLVAEISKIDSPSPTRTILYDVTLRDSDGKIELARARTIELAPTDFGVVATASQPSVEAKYLPRLSALLFERVMRGQVRSDQFQLVSNSLTLRNNRGDSTLEDFRCLVASTVDRSDASIEFKLAGIEMREPAQLRVSRDRRTTSQSTTWELRTAGAALPCYLASDSIEALSILGQRCRFAGTAWVQSNEQQWSGEFAGRFVDVDLEKLVEPFPHKLSGNAEIELSHLSFKHGKLVEAAGAMESLGGVVSQSLVRSSAHSLRLGSNVRIDDSFDSLIAYRQLALGFHIDEGGLSVSGLCGSVQDGIVLVGTSGNVLLDSRGDLLPTIAITRTLVPYSDVQVPATNATEILLRALPLPPPTRPTGRTATRPYSPLRYVE